MGEKKDESIVFCYVVAVSPAEDPSLKFVEKFDEEKLPVDDAKLQVQPFSPR